MSLEDKQGLEWLRMKFNRIKTDDSFRHSALYKLLRDELTAKDHWKQQGRGKPNKRPFLNQQQDDN